MNFLKTTIALAIAILYFNIQGANAQQLNEKELKVNTTPVTRALSAITQLDPVVFEFNTNKFKQLNLPQGKQYGFIAEDVKQFLPGVISTETKWLPAGKNNYRTVNTSNVDYEKLIPLLVGAIKEQQAEIEELKANLHQLKSK
ncbi:tail fiber domain-containing protein [Mucilaginibacter limnophilus]|uniref:Tail fiber domain-containing protein n=1 Tax=Mucilaginibacter limnophilus TaxID=1932778 RepID=A0A437MU87_9SPHI|nr:tail fiber domain-containing protein [Mucilaginibacter limnophilus]RVU01229.1 tail fiber domain-containing protein [Mucilaginibacter limnophilus]